MGHPVAPASGLYPLRFRGRSDKLFRIDIAVWEKQSEGRESVPGQSKGSITHANRTEWKLPGRDGDWYIILTYCVLTVSNV